MSDFPVYYYAMGDSIIIDITLGETPPGPHGLMVWKTFAF